MRKTSLRFGVLLACVAGLAASSPTWSRLDPAPDPEALAKGKACEDWSTTVYAVTGRVVSFDALGPGGADCRANWSHDLDTINDPQQVCDTIDYNWTYTFDGLPEVWFASSPQCSRTFAVPANYTVTLKITDTPGNNNDNMTNPNPPPDVIKKVITANVSVVARDLGGPIRADDGTDLQLWCPYTSSPTKTFWRHAGQPEGTTYTLECH